jgi:hypothetical protein
VHKSLAIEPYSFVTQSGSLSGSFPSLNQIEQNGTGDDPSTYVQFQTPGRIYLGNKSFSLPQDAQPENISSLLLQVNFKVENSSQVWTWSLYDWTTGNWVKVGDSIGLQAGAWNNVVFRITNIGRYVSSSKEIKIRLQSSDASHDLKIDYLALHITYQAVAPTPTPAIPTPMPTKQRYNFPVTFTPVP